MASLEKLKGAKDVGTGKTVTITGLSLTGADSGNYTLVTITTTADITARILTVSGLSAYDKTFDGSPAATLNRHRQPGWHRG